MHNRYLLLMVLVTLLAIGVLGLMLMVRPKRRQMPKFQISSETQQKIDSFEQSDAAYKAAWDQFERAHFQELEALDRMREDRNNKLDDAVRTLRTESAEADITQVKLVKAGPFSVQKRFSQFYAPEKTVSMLKDKGLYDSALRNRVVAEKIELEKYDTVYAFLEREGVAKDFEECEDGQELTPAVSGPKPVPPFGSEIKERK